MQTVWGVRGNVVIRETPITWGIPFGSLCYSKAWRSQMAMGMMPWDDLIAPEGTYIAAARSYIHNKFLAEGRTDWLFMLDSDVCCPPDYLSRLLKHHEEDASRRVLSGWYRQKEEPCLPVVYHWLGEKQNAKGHEIGDWKHYREDEIKPGLQVVDGVGAGCWLVHREVLGKIGPDPFDMLAGGEDLQLCRLMSGDPIYVDGNLLCGHLGVAMN